MTVKSNKICKNFSKHSFSLKAFMYFKQMLYSIFFGLQLRDDFFFPQTFSFN